MIVYGVNPVLELLSARPKEIARILLAEGAKVHDLQRLLRLAREAGIRVERVHRDRIAKTAGAKAHQGVLAELTHVVASYLQIADLLEESSRKGEDPLLLALDQVQDPMHLGTALRCVHVFGGHGVIIPQDRSVDLTPAAIKASAGASTHVKIAREVNLSRALAALKQKGVWVMGADMEGESCDRLDLRGPICLVIGAEGKGLRPLVRETCDRILAIPMAPAGTEGVGSLSVSTAAAVLLYEVRRQRRAASRPPRSPQPNQESDSDFGLDR